MKSEATQYWNQILKRLLSNQILHVVFYCDDKQIEILIAAPNRCFTAVSAENGGFRFSAMVRKSFFLYEI